MEVCSFTFVLLDAGRARSAVAASLCNCCPNPPVWLTHLSRAFSDDATYTAFPLQNETEGTILGLLNVARPLLTYGLSKLRESVPTLHRKHSEAPLNMEVFRAGLVRLALYVVDGLK